MFKSSYKITTVWGIPIKAHTTLIIMFLWFMFDFGLLTGFFLTIGLLCSISLHELGHSLVAIKKGCRVREITLMAFGGAAQMINIPRKPFDEFLMALAGPLVSVALGGLLIITGMHLPLPYVLGYNVNLLVVLGSINIGLAIFNLIPSFPMDGGRIFRAALTPKLGRLRATYTAPPLGKVICIAGGLYAFTRSEWFLVAIAFYIYNAADQEYRMVKKEELASAWGFVADTEEEAFESAQASPGNDNRVVISPPPYKKGPGSTADIHHTDEDNPFTNIFKL